MKTRAVLAVVAFSCVNTIAAADDIRTDRRPCPEAASEIAQAQSDIASARARMAVDAGVSEEGARLLADLEAAAKARLVSAWALCPREAGYVNPFVADDPFEPLRPAGDRPVDAGSPEAGPPGDDLDGTAAVFDLPAVIRAVVERFGM